MRVVNFIANDLTGARVGDRLEIDDRNSLIALLDQQRAPMLIDHRACHSRRFVSLNVHRNVSIYGHATVCTRNIASTTSFDISVQ